MVSAGFLCTILFKLRTQNCGHSFILWFYMVFHVLTWIQVTKLCDSTKKTLELYLVGGIPTPLKNDGVRRLG